jgi:hypothetical protein
MTPGRGLRRPRHEPAFLPRPHVAGYRVMRAACKVARVPVRPRQVVRLQDVHDLLGTLHASLPGKLVTVGTDQPKGKGGTPPGNLRGMISSCRANPWPPASNSAVRERAVIWPSAGSLSWPPSHHATR